jgi:hypothetical protein
LGNEQPYANAGGWVSLANGGILAPEACKPPRPKVDLMRLDAHRGGVRATALNSLRLLFRVYAIDKRPRGLSIFHPILGNSFCLAPTLSSASQATAHVGSSGGAPSTSFSSPRLGRNFGRATSPGPGPPGQFARRSDLGSWSNFPAAWATVFGSISHNFSSYGALNAQKDRSIPQLPFH